MIALSLLDRAGFRPGWVLFDPALAVEPGFLAGLQSRSLRYVSEVPGSFVGSIRGQAARPVGEQSEGLALRAHHKLPTRDAEPETVCPMDLFPFAPELGPAGPHSLVVLRHPWTGRFRYFLSNAPDEAAETLLETCLSRDRILGGVKRGLEGIGFAHFEVRGFLSLKRHLRLSEASLLYQSEQRARQSRAPRVAAP
jgi:hypothetical protein